jgi:hypothetical protein
VRSSRSWRRTRKRRRLFPDQSQRCASRPCNRSRLPLRLAAPPTSWMPNRRLRCLPECPKRPRPAAPPLRSPTHAQQKDGLA